MNINAWNKRRSAKKLLRAIETIDKAFKQSNKYDVLEPNRQRKNPTPERQGEAKLYDMTKRLKGASLGRDLERNYSPARGMIHQFKVNVVGHEGKIRVNGPDGKEATDWFNQVWAKDCDYRDTIDFSTELQNITAAAIREGDLGFLVDDDITPDDSGKLVTWESDQIVPYSAEAWKNATYAGQEPDDYQENGLILSRWGKVKGYIVTGHHGKTSITEKAEGTIYPRDVFKLAKNPWRLNQKRGQPTLIASASNFTDLYEILGAELQSAKRAAMQYAYVKRSEAIQDFDDPLGATGFLPENDGQAQATVDAENANLDAATGARNYESLERHTGGLMDYIDSNDEVMFPDANRPNSSLAAFIEAVNGMSGQAMGLAMAYTRLRADKSFTAFRGDMIMTWVTFECWQKWLERNVADWIAVKVLNWAIRKGEIKAPGAGWERRISWAWPTMPEVKEIDAQKAIAEGLKNGTTDFADLLGPNWREILTGYGEQIDFVKALGLPLGVLETKAGAPAATEPQEDDDANSE